MKAEYMAQALCTRDSVWIRKLRKDFGLTKGPIQLLADNTAAIALAKDHKCTAKTKNTGVCYNLTRDYVTKGKVQSNMHQLWKCWLIV